MMNEIVNPKIDELLMRDQPMFINRLGGSDATAMFRYYRNVNGKKDIIGAIQPLIRDISVYNGYYDLSNDINIKKKNLIEFFDKLDQCYRSNEVQSFACITIKGHPYFRNVKGSYFSYHGTIESPTYFLPVLEKVVKGKTLLIINPFTDEIKKQVPKLKSLYRGKINLECNFKYVKTPITYFDLKKGYLNTPHKNFLETVSFMCKEIDKENYDIALLGCGSYAHFLGEHIKSKGKKAIYIGGVLPSYFGLLSDKTVKHWAFPSYFDFNYVMPLLPVGKLSHTFDWRRESLSNYLYHRQRYLPLLGIFRECRLNLDKHVFIKTLSSQAAEYFFLYCCSPLLPGRQFRNKNKVAKLANYIRAYNYIPPINSVSSTHRLDTFRAYMATYLKINAEPIKNP